MRGYVISDLHLFSWRSIGFELFNAFKHNLTNADFLVLNGDTFDFRLSELSSPQETVDQAIAWLRTLLGTYPNCHIYLTIGNHDALTLFIERCSQLAQNSNFSLHQYYLRLGSKLFIHGDVCNRRMTQKKLLAYRAKYATVKTPLWAMKLLSKAIVLSRVHFVAYATHPKLLSAGRIMYYLGHADAEVLSGVADIYFGHTHYPFTDYEYRGIKFHNTGSGIRYLGFSPREVVLEQNN